MNLFDYNPLYDKSPSGAVQKGTKVTYTLKITKSIFPYEIYLVYRKDGTDNEEYVSMIQNYADERYYYFTTTIEYMEAGHYWYHFKISEKNGTYYLQKAFNYYASGIDKVKYPYLQLVYNEDSTVEDSIHNGIIYQIFVFVNLFFTSRRFYP